MTSTNLKSRAAKGSAEDVAEIKVDEVNEKDVGSITQIEDAARTRQTSISVSSSKSLYEDGELLAEDVRPAAERRLVRKLDMRLLPTIVLIFIMNYIDVSFVFLNCLVQKSVLKRQSAQRTAITSAKLQGLTQDLHLSGSSIR